LRALGPEPWNRRVRAAVPPAERRALWRKTRIGCSTITSTQVILKPSPPDLQELYLKSLESIGIDPLKHDIRFVEDDWESPNARRLGLGWEVGATGWR
jgi:glycyl-tRNA synthetase alpha chain